MRTDLGTESKARRISHEDPCNSVLDSSASSWALMICKVGFSQLLWGRKPYWLLLRASSLSQIKLIRWTIIPISSFLGVSRRLSGRRSSRVAISGSTLGFGQSHLRFHSSGIIFCSQIWFMALWKALTTSSGHSFIMAYDKPLGPGTDPAGAFLIAYSTSSSSIGRERDAANNVRSWGWVELGIIIAFHMHCRSSGGIALWAAKLRKLADCSCGADQSILWWSKKVVCPVPLNHFFQWLVCRSCICMGSTTMVPSDSLRLLRSYCGWWRQSMDLIACATFPEATAFSLAAEAFFIARRSSLLCRPCNCFLTKRSCSRKRLGSLW